MGSQHSQCLCHFQAAQLITTATMSQAGQQQQGQAPSPGSPTKEELEALAARSNAVIEKGLHQLEEEQGGVCRGWPPRLP